MKTEDDELHMVEAECVHSEGGGMDLVMTRMGIARVMPDDKRRTYDDCREGGD